MLSSMIGGDLMVADNRFQSHGYRKDQNFFIKGTSVNTISLFSACQMLLHISLAADHWRIGRFFRMGIAQVLLVIFAVLFLSQLSLHVYFRTWVFGTSFSYAGVWRLTFGPMFQIIPRILVILGLFNFTILVPATITDFVHSAVTNNFPNTPPILSNRWVIIYCLSIITTVPSVLARRYSRLKATAYIGNLLLVTGIVTMIVNAFRHPMSGPVKYPLRAFGGSPWQDIFSLINVGNCIVIMHPFMQYVTEDMSNATNTRTVLLIWILFIVKVVILLLCGFVCYFSVYRYTDSTELFSSSMKQNTVEAVIIHLTTVLNLVLTQAHYVYVAALKITGLFVKNNESTFCTVLSGIFGMLLSSAMSFTSDRVKKIITVVGSTATAIVVYLIPPICYLGLFRTTSKWWAAACILLLVTGTIITIGVTYVTWL